MNANSHERDLWPTPLQEALLRAAFLAGEAGVKAWEVWKAGVNLDGHIDPDSFRLFPQLYRNLQAQGIDDPLTLRFKGVYRQTWYKNQRLVHDVATALRGLREAGVELLLLSGAALALFRTLPDYGVCPIGEFPVLVRPEQAGLAITGLQASGWAPAWGLPGIPLEDYVSAGAMHLFRKGAGHRLRLFWSWLPGWSGAGADDDFWAGAVAARVGDVPVHSLNPSYQLLGACVPDLSTRSTPLFVRAADAMLVLKTLPADIDWGRLVGQAQGRRLLLPVAETLGYLYESLDAPIPPAVLARLRALPVTRWERAEHLFKTRQATLWGRLPALCCDYLRRNGDAGWLRRIAGFPSFLQHSWRLRYVWQVPAYVAVRGGQRILGRQTWDQE